jgi:uncharacterized protein (UPF0305 family)
MTIVLLPQQLHARGTVIPGFFTSIRWINTYYVPPKKEKKRIVNVPIVRE